MTHLATTTFGKLGRVFNGNSINESDKSALYSGISDGHPFIATKDVGFDNQISYESGVRIPLKYAGSFKLAPAGSVLVCAEGGSAGRKVGHTDRPVHFGNKLFAICPDRDALGRFVFYYCLSDRFAEEFRGVMSGLIGGVSLKKFKDLQLPIPPLPEQERIVSILDEIFAGLRSSRSNVENNQRNALAIFESYLHSVFAERHEGWETLQLSELCTPSRVITYGVIKLGKEDPSGVPCLRTSNVRWLRIDADSVKRIAPTLSDEFSRTILEGDEVLVNVRGTLGGVAVVAPHMAGWNVSREVAVVPINPSRVLPAFVAYSIGAGASQEWLSDVKKGAAYVGINIEDLRKLPLSVPPLAEQQRIVKTLDALWGETQRLAKLYEQKGAELAVLRAGVLREAFTGHL